MTTAENGGSQFQGGGFRKLLIGGTGQDLL